MHLMLPKNPQPTPALGGGCGVGRDVWVGIGVELASLREEHLVAENILKVLSGKLQKEIKFS